MGGKLGVDLVCIALDWLAGVARSSWSWVW